MNSKVKQSIIAGVIATAVMTVVMFVAPLMGMPEMNPPQMLSSMMGLPIIVGWIMHFMVGIIFALAYTFLALPILGKISSDVLKGTIFGVIIFIFAQIMMALMGAIMGGMPSPEGNIVLMIMGSIIGHIVFGIVVALIVKSQSISADS